MKHSGVLWAAGIVLLLAAFFKFAMVGYSFLGFVLACVAAAILLIAFLPGIWKIIFICLMGAFLCVFAVFEVQVARGALQEPEEDADYVILLGCGVHGTTPSLTMVNRVNGAFLYLTDNPETKVVVSGGRGPGEDITEAEAMKKLLLSKGISEGRILVEDRSTSTEENLMFSVRIIGEDISEKKILICSSDYHVCRAQYLAEKCLGADFGGIPAKTTRPVLFFSNFLREGCGMIYYKFYELLG